MFWGSHDHVLDDKGRTSLPKEFREALAAFDGDPWITAGECTITIYPPAVFEELRRRLTGPGSHAASVRQLQRLILGMASRCTIDKAGRILIPPKLREWKNLQRDVVFMGLGDLIELWDREEHANALRTAQGHYAEFSAAHLGRSDS
jgi:MraZ protein